MKNIKLILAFIVLAFVLTSCSSDNDDPILEIDPFAEYYLVGDIESNGHLLEMYAERKNLTTGYNEILLGIKDVTTGDYFSDPIISWMPMMHMMERDHSCPRSEIDLMNESNSISKGFLVFQMPGTAEEYWDITFTYQIGGKEYMATMPITVTAPADNRQKVTSFVGSDGSRYVLAMVSPTIPEVKVNDFKAVLFKMENMDKFPIVEDFKVALDPRMPGMGNHGSPNNKDLVYDPATKSYTGKLSLTMTGYWKINMVLFDQNEAVIKGETVTEDREGSSLYFEVEF